MHDRLVSRRIDALYQCFLVLLCYADYLAFVRIDGHKLLLLPSWIDPSKHVYMGSIWAESGYLSHWDPTWAPYRVFCPNKTHIGPILVKFDQQTCIYGNHMGRFWSFIPFGSYMGPI